MSDTSFRLIFLALAGIVVPCAYLALCVWMFLRKVWWFAYIAYFCLFGAIGGWCFALAMLPSGLAAVSMLFLTSVVLVSCLLSALVLQFRKQKNRFEKMAMVGGYSYPLLMGALFLIVVIFFP